MGSASAPEVVDVPQHELPPPITRNATSPYLSFTMSLMFVLMFSPLLAAHNVFRFHHVIPRTAFRIQKPEQFLQCLRIGRIPKEGSITANLNQPFILQLFEMVGQSGIRN